MVSYKMINFAKISKYRYNLKLCCSVSVELFFRNTYGHRFPYKTG